ncbi:short-chain dehydrogenase/reductase SDR [Ancylobacter novellus DSM 506]|uniref:Short-chain dehydrogenase/reductase SDR n=1 Tax=Ancylobacter novellus (strain ATCC 8093 / DSM 506 / JCM 20403 / CCM 1077 / IAM 12100 / NBRC 12443 / NCIMB 10456) TaxID=639283 RepID=D7A9A1_ANCN5|nr:SDR family oxidoreductase [Ancylobacter novellus]ADH90663.1 short-chain dehydrogenase/reductase SDR [Ancylobacter novellus DSM 506]
MTDPTLPRPFRLDGRVALVTGAGRGLGLEMAKALASAGASVIVNGRDAGRLEEAAEAIRAATGRQAGTAPFDVADLDAAREALAAIVRDHGRLDILVNNVGVRDRRPLSDFSAEEAATLIATNLVAPTMLAREAAALMAAQGHGRLIFVTSIAGHVALPRDPVYTAAKAGLTGLMRALAIDYARAGVTSNAIAPGMFATQTNERLVADADFSAFVDVRVPLGRWGRPQEIGPAAVFLASDEASFVNGHVLVVDGGQTVRM